MLATNTLATINRESAPAVAAAASTEELGSQQFLTLMLAQIKNQDPLKPLDPAEFLGQLAQFSTVTGVQDVNRSIGDLATSLRSSQATEATSMVGRNVLAAGSELSYGGGETVRGAVGTPDGATRLDITIRDASGTLVRRLPLVPQADMTEFQWDGITDRGTRAEPGPYRIEAVASVGGRAESVEPLLQRRVNSVSIDAQGRGLTLNTSFGPIALGDVRRIM
jgi:flagellar basal-body rod modification protein FlgD